MSYFRQASCTVPALGMQLHDMRDSDRVQRHIKHPVLQATKSSLLVIIYARIGMWRRL